MMTITLDMVGAELVVRHCVNDKIVELAGPVRGLLRFMTGARHSNLYVAVDSFSVSALNIRSGDMWNNQCHAGDLRNWEPMDWEAIVCFQVCHP